MKLLTSITYSLLFTFKFPNKMQYVISKAVTFVSFWTSVLFFVHEKKMLNDFVFFFFLGDGGGEFYCYPLLFHLLPINAGGGGGGGETSLVTNTWS